MTVDTDTLPGREQAAEARAAAVRAPADRPSARRGGAAPGAPALARTQLSRVEFRAESGGDALVFDGLASVYERGYEMWDYYGPYTEIVSAGAGAVSLASGPDVAFLLNHRGMTLARTKSGTLELDETADGLHTVARLDRRNSDVQNIQVAVERGDLDEMSFAFRIVRGQWSPDYTEYRINEYDIARGDVSIVNFGANPETSGNFRSAQTLLGISALGDLDDIARAEAALTARRHALTPPASRAAGDDSFTPYEQPHPRAARYLG